MKGKLGRAIGGRIAQEDYTHTFTQVQVGGTGGTGDVHKPCLKWVLFIVSSKQPTFFKNVDGNAESHAIFWIKVSPGNSWPSQDPFW